MSELKQSIAQLLIDNFKGATSKKASDMAIAIMAFVNADREREIESAFCGTPGTGECSCRKFADNPLKCDNRRTQPEATKPAQDLSAAIPDGWKLVPVEPTDEMIEELRINIDFSYEEGLEISTGKYHPCALIKDGSIGEAYCAMLAAAPLASTNALSAGDRVDAERYRYIRDTATLDNAVWEALEGYGMTNGAGELLEDEYRAGMDRAIDRAIQAQKDGHGHD